MSKMNETSVIDVKEDTDFFGNFFNDPFFLGQPEPILSEEERMKYTFKAPFPQNFSLPSNIVYYISRNPKFPNGHLKLISTCKSLARMSRILPVKRMWHLCDDNINKWNVNNEAHVGSRVCKEVSININNNYFKIWVHEIVQIRNQKINDLASFLIKHVYKFSLLEIFVGNQVLTLKELQILVSEDKLEDVFFDENIFKNDDGSITEFEKVFQLLCCKTTRIYFHPEQHGVGKNTTCKIIEILSSDQIQNELDIILWNIPQNFDFHLFSHFLKLNLDQKQHKFDLKFSDGISEAYKNHLQKFVNEIIQIRGIYAHSVPFISFRGHDEEAFKQLIKMRSGEVEGILRKPFT